MSLTAQRTGTDDSVVATITRFLFEESAALDDMRYDDWFALLDDDYDYRMPVPISREDPELPRYSDTSVLAWESRGSLEHRFRRNKSEYAWADRPSAYIRHFVSNVLVDPGPGPGEWDVRSNVFVVRSRMPDTTTVVSAGRRDLIREGANGELKLARRIVHLDNEQPTAAQLAVLY